MRISLSTADLSAVSACSRELLSALDHPSPDRWAERVIKHAQPLLRADRSFMSLPMARGFVLHQSDADMVDAGRSYVDYYHKTDVYVNGRRQELGLQVFSYDMLITAAEQTRSEFWHDWILKHQLCKPAGLSRDVPGCPVPATLMVYKEKPTSKAFGARELAILQLLQSPFEAALKALDRFNKAGADLLAHIDRLSRPVVLVAPAGVAHVNAAFSAAMGQHAVDALEHIVPRVRAIVRSGIAALDHPLSGTVPGPSGKRVTWSVHLFSPDPNQTFALIELEEPGAPYTATMVSDRFGLTVRQAQVAVLMAARRSYKEIAGQLAIRPNTARRHCEQVLLRLGLHSRDEVAQLLDGGSQHRDVRPTG